MLLEEKKIDEGKAENRTLRALSAVFIIATVGAASLLASLAVVAYAQTLTYQPFIYVSALPNPVEVRKSVFISGFFDCPPPYPVSWGGQPFRNVRIEVTKPDGSTDALGPFTTDEIAAFGTSYTPTQVGKYKIKATFPGQVIPVPDTRAPGAWLTTVGNWPFLPCTSKEFELTVQSEPTPTWKEAPLPSGYWWRPISAVNREWRSISGNWLTNPENNFAKSTKAPNTAHIIWARPLAMGGLVGGEEYGSHSFHMGQAYEGKWVNPVVINGLLYYMEYRQGHSQYYTDIVCVNIRTGQELWRVNATGRGDPVKVQLSGGGAAYGFWQGYTRLTLGQIYYYESPNQHGAFAYLWATGGLGATARWEMYDAWKGDWIMSFTGVPSGTRVFGPNGEILIYTINTAQGWLALWNSSAAIPLAGPVGTDVWQYRLWPGATIDVSKPYNWTVTSATGVNTTWTVNPFSWNVSIPKGLPGTVWAVGSDMLIGTNLGTTYYSYNPWSAWAISLKPETRGQVLWRKDHPAPANNITMQRICVSFDDGVFVLREKETLKYYGYDLATGELKWGPTELSRYPYDMFEPQTAVAYGKMFLCAYGGALYGVDLKTGRLLWTYEAKDVTGEGMYGENFPLKIGTVADNKIYIVTSEHSPTNPLHRGARLRCIDVNEGKELWNITHWSSVQHGTYVVIADGYLIDCDAYDLQVYCFGKGQTAMTMTVSPKVTAKGSSVLIEGTVTDQSPGAKGTPAIADEYMSVWMEYLYKQQAIPAEAKGVPVKLQAIGSDGSVVDIGTVTSDMGGLFKKLWAPPAEGEYTIIATFEGSESYWPSFAETAIGVTAAPAASIAPSASAPSPSAPSTASPSIPPAVEAPSIDIFMITAAVIVIAIIIASVIVLKRRRQ